MENHNSSDFTLRKNAYILLITAVITKIIGALFKIPLSSDFCLSDVGFGYFSAAYDLYTPIYILALSGFPVAVSKIIADFTAKGEKRNAFAAFKTAKGILFTVAVIGTLLFGVAVFLIARFTDTADNSLLPMLSIVPGFFFCCISSVYRGYFEGISNMAPTAVSNLIEAMSKLVLGFSFALIIVKSGGSMPLAASGALSGITLGTVFSSAYLYIKFVRCASLKNDADYAVARFDKNSARLVSVIIFTVAVSSLSGSFVALVDTVTVRYQLRHYSLQDAEMLKSLYGDVISEYTSGGKSFELSELPTLLYGIKSKAHTLYNIVPTVTQALGVSLVPTVAYAFIKREKENLNKNLSTILKITAIISVPAGLGLAVLNRRIMFLLYGESVSSAIGGNMLAVFGIATVFSGISVVQICILQSVNRHFTALINTAVAVAVKTALNILLTSNASLNIYACVISTAACYAVIFLLNTLSIGFAVGDFSHIKCYYKPLFAALLCAVAAYLVSIINASKTVTVISILAAIAVYTVFLFTFKTVCDEDILALPGGNKLLNVLKKLKFMA